MSAEDKAPFVGPTLRSYTPACGLLEAGLQDTLTLQVKVGARAGCPIDLGRRIIFVSI